MSEDKKKLIEHLDQLGTEKPNPKSKNLDRLSAIEICTLINEEDQTVASTVAREIPRIAQAAEMAAEVLKKGGRLFYIGAGTSGRLGVLDAAECPPTFGCDPGQVIGVIAGGRDTLVRSAEGIEDRSEEAPADLAKFNFGPDDMLVGLAASIKTPYTLAGIKYAIDKGAGTVVIVCNRINNIEIKPDIIIQLDVGNEIITGSTRMKSGTAQKMTLNMISTTAMVLLGKCYGNLMVDLQATSDKLAARSRKILIELLDIDYDEADRFLTEAAGSVKLAIAMKRLGIDAETARKQIEAADGFLWKLLDNNRK